METNGRMKFILLIQMLIFFGQYQDAIADSKKLTCRPPPEIPGVVLPDFEVTEHPVGTSFTYSCPFGYVTSNHISTCVNRAGIADWTVPYISCIPRSCGDPGYIPNGRRIGNLFTFPNKISFECHEGYKIHGLNEIYCQASGEWSGRLPTCELVTCKQPTAPDFGGVQLHGDSKVGSTVIYFCNKDKKILGERMSYCTATGQWSNDPPKCLSYCTVPDIENGEMGFSAEHISTYRRTKIFQKISTGEEVYQDEKRTLQCDEDYFPSDGEEVMENNKVEVTCNNGTWSRIPQCLTKVRCEEPIAPDYGKFRLNGDSKVGSTVIYFCDEDKRMVGERISKCLKTGQWTYDPPKCLNNSEGNITPTIHSDPEITKHAATENSSELSIHPTSGLEPTRECYCTYNQADYIIRATVKSKVLKDGDKVKQGETVIFYCMFRRRLAWDYGLVIQGSTSITCTTCQIWSTTDIPKCPALQDGQPLIVLNDSFKMKPGGVVEVEAGKSFALWCSSDNKQPEWYLRGKNVTNVTRSAREGDFSILYSSIFISNAGNEDSGIYECITTIKSPDRVSPDQKLRTVLNLQVKKYLCHTRELNYSGLIKPSEESFRHSQYFNISCEKGFEKSTVKSVISCLNGQWNITENPCTKEIYETRTILPVLLEKASTIRTDVLLTTQPSVEGLELTNSSSSNSEETNDCYCTYEREDFITVRAKDKRLRYGDKVKRGETVSFKCGDYKVLSWLNGLRVYGVANVTCTACDKWRNARNPACSTLPHGLPFIVLDNPLKLLAKGTAIVDVGMTFRLLCGSTFYYPTWTTPYPGTVTEEKFIHDGNTGISVFYSSVFITANSDQGNGKYECSVRSQWKTTLVIEVRTPGCSIAELSEILPDGVIPEMKDVTGEYVSNGSRIKLKCDGELVFIGNRTVKCKNNGKWQLESYQCVPGCLLKRNESSSLVVNPRKDYYRLGDHIVLSCPYEEELTSDVKRLMCLGDKWSHPLPDCKNES